MTRYSRLPSEPPSSSRLSDDDDMSLHELEPHGGAAGASKEKADLAREQRSSQSASLESEQVVRTHKWWSDEEENAVRRKLDVRIVPVLFVTYLLAALDRSNIGNAKTAGMNKDLGISDPEYQWLLTIFYVAYIIFQFQVLAYKIFPPSKWMAWCLIVWGLASTLQSTAHNWSALMACRWWLGVSEAGYGTGVILYYSFFYPKHEIGFRFAIFLTASALASCIGGAIAYGIQQADSAIENWRLLFIVEGIPTILLAFVVLYVLPDSIASSKFLTQREKEIAEARLFRDTVDVSARAALTEVKHAPTGKIATLKHAMREKVDFKNAGEAFKDPISYINASLLFIVNVGFSSIPVYLPTILTDMGYTSIRSQGLSAPPYLVAWFMALFIMYVSTKANVRGPFIVLVTLVGAAGYLTLALTEVVHARYAAVFLVTMSLFSMIPLVYMWLLANAPGESRRGAALIIFAVAGQCGPLLGTRLFPKDQGPRYEKGMFINAGVLLLGLTIAASTSVLLAYRNKKKAANIERSESADEPIKDEWSQRLDIARNGTDSPYFRYMI